MSRMNWDRARREEPLRHHETKYRTRPIEARFAGWCASCNARIEVGSKIHRVLGQGPWVHLGCGGAR